eukprot:2081614-Rhodomonas_salina.1
MVPANAKSRHKSRLSQNHSTPYACAAVAHIRLEINSIPGTRCKESACRNMKVLMRVCEFAARCESGRFEGPCTSSVKFSFGPGTTNCFVRTYELSPGTAYMYRKRTPAVLDTPKSTGIKIHC